MYSRRKTHELSWRGVATSALCLVAVLCAGCATRMIDPEVADMRFHNWWNYYNRGSERLAKGDLEGAKRDFERCLGLRSGARFGFPEDMWRARTYGLHFLEGYFPNRELGVSLYGLGKPDEAIRYLGVSLDQTPSGRAKHYMNLARKQTLASAEAKPPEIVLTPESENRWTRMRERTIAGRTSGRGLIGSIVINNSPEFVELAREQVDFSRSIRLKAGRNDVLIEARDLADRKTARTVVWYADWLPPGLDLIRAERDGNELVLDLRCHDDSALAAVLVDGAKRFDGSGNKPVLEYSLKLRVAAGTKPLIEVKDLAGNVVRTRVGDLVARNEGACILYELASAGETGGLLDSGQPPLKTAPRPGGAGDRDLSLQITGARPLTRVYDEEYFLDGTAAGSAGLQSIALNGEEILNPVNRGAVQSFFARRIPLAPGTNRFDIVVCDAAGNSKSRKITVVREIPGYLHQECRLSMGVSPLISDEERGFVRLIRRCLEEELLKEPVRFHVLEREEGWDLILREQALSLSDLADPRAALKVGQMLPADTLLVGTLIRDGTGLTVYTRVVDTTTGRILATEDVYSEALQANLAYQMAGLTMKIEQKFPLFSGRIIEHMGAKARIDVGSVKGLRTDTRFLIVHGAGGNGSTDPGMVCRADSRLVELRTDEVKEDTAVARIDPRSAKALIGEGDHVYAR